MFCSECGKQIPDNTKFCNYCGAKQPALDSPEPPTVSAAAAPQQAQQPQQPQQPQQFQQPQPVSRQQGQASAKKKKSIAITVAVVLVAAIGGKLIGESMIAPSLSEGGSANKGSQGGQSQQVNVSNSSYNKLLADEGIVHLPPVFGTNTASFAAKQADGSIICHDFSYKDDVIKQWAQTYYLPVSGLSAAEKAQTESAAKAQMAAYEALDCCTVSYDMGTRYFSVTATFYDVDKAANYTALYKAGLNEGNGQMSMSATKKARLVAGYTQK